MTERKWWHGKTAYQIYPKSFLDTNGDGIGDLRGVIRKLDYLQDLGVEIVWLSPIYCSPMADQGYDISDYYQIDPRFGTMDDMDELLAEAKKRGIGVVMDLVVNHCSDEHEWFQKACLDPDGPYGKFFYIEDYQNGKAPSNWRGYFGGSVWDPLPGHSDKCYMHLFHRKQPDLNWENPALREEIYKMINWWLDKGLAGFRIDAIINIKKKLPYKDYPVDREDGLSSIFNMLEDAHGIGDFLGEMRDRCFLPHDAFTVGEVFNAKEEELKSFIGPHGYFSSMFDFGPTLAGRSFNGWYDCRPVGPDDYRDSSYHSQMKVQNFGFLSNILGNHDEPSGFSRYLPDGDVNGISKKALATAMFLLKGLPFMYQGQEIGTENVAFQSISEINDVNTLDQYQVALEAGLSAEEAFRAVAPLSRDNARTPFPWNAHKNAGFSEGTPWLKVNPRYTDINLESQWKDPDSVFSYYKKLIRLRKNETYKDVIVYGSFEPVWEDKPGLMAFYRRNSSQTLLVLINFQTEERILSLDGTVNAVLINNYPDVIIHNHTITLKGYQAVVLVLN